MYVSGLSLEIGYLGNDSHVVLKINNYLYRYVYIYIHFIERKKMKSVADNLCPIFIYRGSHKETQNSQCNAQFKHNSSMEPRGIDIGSGK